MRLAADDAVPAGSPPVSSRAAPVSYPTRCYRALAPTHLAAAAAAHGGAAPALSGPFRYCEPGCGTGLTLAVLAAANPRARFTGIDADPGHVAAARELQAACGLANLDFVQADFDTAAAAACTEPCDFIALH
ncbi:MAG: class I SAM-dependent methyltransferase, partial [Planctomycetes bacterium]|nr:class I SAM-dependent methyltransferase [Planctomycetota bacterium]